MTDHPAADLGAKSTPALISYVTLLVFTLTVAAIFAIIFTRTTVDPLMAGVLGTVLGATGGGFSDVRGFWLGASSSSKTAQAELAASNKAAQGALAQLAGSGPPPPAVPDIAQEPKP